MRIPLLFFRALVEPFARIKHFLESLQRDTASVELAVLNRGTGRPVVAEVANHRVGETLARKTVNGRGVVPLGLELLHHIGDEGRTAGRACWRNPLPTGSAAS